MNSSKNKSSIPEIAVLLYLLVHFIPDFGGADVMGAQWLYLSIVDLLIFGYILLNRTTYNQAISSILNLKFTLLYSFLVFWAALSVIYALNSIEVLVCLARLISTYLIFINLSVLFYKRDLSKLFSIASILVAAVLFFDATYVITTFSKNMSTMSLDSNIVSLTGKNGNKNVMAASLLIKFPFVLFLIINDKFWGKIVGFIVLFLGIMALFILNTRSTYVGIGVVFVLLAVSTYLLHKKNGIRPILIQLSYFIVPMLFAFFAANTMLSKAVELQGFQGGYGTVTKRLGDITVASEQNSRIHLWESAIDYSIKNPLFGAGYGNWKLASIPYEKEFTDDLFVPYHCHNDFLEMFADLGLIGGLSYLGMFLLLGIFTLKSWKQLTDPKHQLIVSIALMAVGCYFVDAFFNFPAERTSMQTMFAISAAFLLAPSHLLQDDKSNFKWINAFLLICVLLILGSIYVNSQTYISLKVQKYVVGEINKDPKLPLDEVKDAFPAIPNLSTSTLPIKALVSRYYLRDNNLDEAMRLLNESEDVNPYIHYNDFIKTSIYSIKGDYDSTFFYAKRAFYNRPRANSFYKNMIFAAVKLQDTAEATRAFKTFTKYRNTAEGWNQYILALAEIKKTPYTFTKSLLDSAVLKFPADSDLFKTTRSAIYGNAIINGSIPNYADIGSKTFGQGQYASAASYFIKASEADPSNYAHFENIGLCYYALKNFDKAVIYFDKAMKFPAAKTGKSEFFKALCLIASGKKESACMALQIAKEKGYPDAEAIIAKNCTN